MISCTGLRLSYRRFQAVAGVDLDVGRGELFALLGTNGAGKTSMMDLIRGHRRPSAGTVQVLGLDPVRRRRELAPLIGVVPQDSGFAPALTVAETLRVWARLAGHQMSATALGEVGLEDRAGAAIRHLSGGERRRLDLAVALAGNPPVLLLDEPTTGLDPEGRDDLWALIRQRVTDGVTVLLTTHYLEEAEAYADRFAILHHGRIAAAGERGADVVGAFREAGAGDEDPRPGGAIPPGARREDGR
jgi:ABC-2 type transport system ATP-binding protein